jgi:hypothetical protein
MSSMLCPVCWTQYTKRRLHWSGQAGAIELLPLLGLALLLAGLIHGVARTAAEGLLLGDIERTDSRLAYEPIHINVYDHEFNGLAIGKWFKRKVGRAGLSWPQNSSARLGQCVIRQDGNIWRQALRGFSLDQKWNEIFRWRLSDILKLKSDQRLCTSSLLWSGRDNVFHQHVSASAHLGAGARLVKRTNGNTTSDNRDNQQENLHPIAYRQTAIGEFIVGVVFVFIGVVGQVTRPRIHPVALLVPLGFLAVAHATFTLGSLL